VGGKVAIVGTGSRRTVGIAAAQAVTGVAVCDEGGQATQAGGHRPSGPSSGQRSAQTVVGAMARGITTCARINAKMNKSARLDAPITTRSKALRSSGPWTATR
jgi:hypothetical protein